MKYAVKRPARGLWMICLACAYLVIFERPGRTQGPTLNGEGTGTHIRVSSDLVLIPVTVVDRRDGFVPGLQKEHFRLYEGNVEQVITHFSVEDVPISVGFIFDASTSMRDKLSKSREAVARFLNTANPEDEHFLVQFNDRPELVQDFTTNAEELQQSLMWIRLGGRTALLDAIHFSIQQMKRAHNSRKALIIISDGGDNCSRYSRGN